ncbi:MAG: HAMP domain-containing histidine kinase [Rhodospirillaceae bacterium]|nr:HAMP domain-containing histidine kinase [Rhodospirillaceae bacterium]
MDKQTSTTSIFRGLSARLLMLTVLFVMLAELLIYTPSISRYRKAYLEEHIATAHLAALALEATPDNMVSKELENELLFHADAYGIVLKYPTHRVLMLSKDMPPKVDVMFDLRGGSPYMWITDAFKALVRKDNRVMRIVGMSPKMPDVIVEAVMDEAPMRMAMLDFSARILQLSIVISLLTAGLVYLSLHRVMVRPMGRLTRSMIRFREHPEDETLSIRPSGRSDEIGIAEQELAIMQDEVRGALKQKDRLAALGTAVAKINHDLRNSLMTAILVSDKLSYIDDPVVREVTPTLLSAIDKAVVLCSQTLDYVGGAKLSLKPAAFHLSELIAEVSASVREDILAGGTEPGNPAFAIVNNVDFEVDLVADRAQLFRSFNNLILNARQANVPTITITAAMDEGRITVDVIDNGPGLPQKAQDGLFRPFAGSARDGGSGLGLVIARDIARAHGGDLVLVKTGEGGTHFQMDLPIEKIS